MYTPRTVPNDAASLSAFLSDELSNIANALTDQSPFLFLQTQHVAPAKPRDGFIYRADGTDWNPGSGSGFYGYRDGAWHLLG